MNITDQIRTPQGKYPVKAAHCEKGKLNESLMIRFDFIDPDGESAAHTQGKIKQPSLEELAFFCDDNGRVHSSAIEEVARKTGPLFGPNKHELLVDWIVESELVSAALKIQMAINCGTDEPALFDGLTSDVQTPISKTEFTGKRVGKGFSLFSLSVELGWGTVERVVSQEVTLPMVKRYAVAGAYDYVFIGQSEDEAGNSLVFDLFALPREITSAEYLAACDSFSCSLHENFEEQESTRTNLVAQAKRYGIDVSAAESRTTGFDGLFTTRDAKVDKGDVLHLQKLVHAIASLHLVGVSVDLFQSSETDDFMMFPNYLGYLWYRFAYQTDQVRIGVCEVCGRGFSMLKGRGKPRKYCSEKCKTAAKNKRAKDEKDLIRSLFLEEGRSVTAITDQLYGRAGTNRANCKHVADCLHNYPVLKRKIRQDLCERKGAPFARRCVDEGVFTWPEIALECKALGIEQGLLKGSEE